MDYLLYLTPVIFFIITTIIMYFVSEEKEKNKLSNVFFKNMLPASVLSLLVFIIIKYRNTSLLEPMMKGNYFD